MFFLVDCNNFYVSCERIFRPDLFSKPVVVLSNNDGCVISRSQEAKDLGIPMGAPAFKYKFFFEKNNVNVFSSNFALYGDISNRVMSILSDFSPMMEVYSIDEAFLKIDSIDIREAKDYALEIKDRIYKWTGIPVSVGIAQTKTLSKVAIEIAKKFQKKTGGVYVVDNEEKRQKALKWLSVDDIWGIGRRHSKRLKSLGITKASRFLELSDVWIKKNMSVSGLRVKRELQGESVFDLEDKHLRKSITTSRSFERNYTEFDELRERIVSFAVSCSGKLRRQQSVCNTMEVFVRTNSFREDLSQYSKKIVIHLPFATNSAIELSKFAVSGLRQIFKDSYEYKKAGVVVMDIEPENPHQLLVFGNSDFRHKKLMEAIDRLNKNFGKQVVKLAAQDFGRTWKMRQEKLSPRYTTKIDEIINVSSG